MVAQQQHIVIKQWHSSSIQDTGSKGAVAPQQQQQSARERSAAGTAVAEHLHNIPKLEHSSFSLGNECVVVDVFRFDFFNQIIDFANTVLPLQPTHSEAAQAASGGTRHCTEIEVL